MNPHILGVLFLLCNVFNLFNLMIDIKLNKVYNVSIVNTISYDGKELICMSDYWKQKVERQKEEIKTIKERTIKLNLSDADCMRISSLAGKSGLSVGEFLASFIGDLVDGTYSNGSDERDRADQWYERCWFSHRYDGEEDRELLAFMLNWGHDVDDFLTAIDEFEYYEENPEEWETDTKGLHGANLWFEDDIEAVTKPYLEKNPDADLKAEIEKCRKWLKELQELQGTYDKNTKDSFVENDLLMDFRKKFESGYDLTKLMNEMEFVFKIPMIDDPLFNKDHSKVIELYREVSNARDI